ncbi:unnamed protein product [Aspergillus oryzae]|nr:unnamed protein product [Aspergillus oryzae]
MGISSDLGIVLGKKLKRRLEDLEKRAASASESPERSNERTEAPKSSHPAKPRARNSRASKSNGDATRRATAERTPAYDGYAAQDDRGAMFSHQCTRQLSASPPPVYSYPSYSHLEPYGQSPYGHPHPYHSIPSTYSDMYNGEYGGSVPSILPVTMTTTGPVKRPHVYADEDIVSPFSMSYASMAGIDLCPSSQHLSESNIPVHTPPCSLSRSARNPIFSKTNSLPSDAAAVARLQR